MTTQTLANDARLDDLAAAGQLWPLLAACERRLADDPSAERARTYRGAALAGLGVGELALESIEGLDTADAKDIRKASVSMPSSRNTPHHAIDVCEKNLAAIGEYARELRDAFDGWAGAVRVGERRFFRCGDGNVLCDCAGRLTSARDEQHAARSVPLGFSVPEANTNVSELPGMLVIAGGRTPWLIDRVLGALRGGCQGYSPRVFIVEPLGASAVLDGLAMADFSVMLRTASTRWLVGPGAADDLRDTLMEVLEWKLPAGVISVDANESIAGAIKDATHAQLDMHRELTEAARRDCMTLTREHWQKRFESAIDTNNNPLHVLLPATRYSSFVRHAMEDLAGAIRRSGHEATVLLEPADDLRPAATFELGAHVKVQPDLTITANWPRATRTNAWPAGAPAVCWVQDMLGHVLDPGLGAAQGELDFMAGLVNGAMFRDFGYPKERAVFLSTPACPVKFHDAPTRMPVDRVDVAYVSHQSESPEAMVERVKQLAQSSTERTLIERIAGEVQLQVEGGHNEAITYHLLEKLTESCTNDIIGRANTATVSRLMLMLTMPLAERAHRHTTLRWAASACKRHGLVLGLYGDGWERTRFKSHARGRLEHSEALRAIYQSAGCHLHASLSTNAHQRVFECALSGGLMLRRGPSPDGAVVLQTQQCILAIGEPDFERIGYHGYLIATGDDPLEPDAGVYDVVRLCNTLGRKVRPAYDHEGTLIRPEWLDRTQATAVRKWLPEIPLEQFPDWSFDRGQQTLFCNETELEEMILRAVHDAHWRRETVAQHRERVLAFNTTDSFWSRLLHSIRAGLHSSGEYS